MKKALTVLAIAGVVLGGIGFAATSQSASAQEAETATQARFLGPINGVLDQLVEQGTITADQAQAIRDALVAKAPGPRDFDRPGFGHPRAGLETVAEVLGMSTDDLVAALQDGQTIADIAGDELQSVTDALVEKANARIDQAVESGRIDADQAADAKAEVAERVDAMVNGEMPRGDCDGPRAGGGFGPMGGGHMGGGHAGGGHEGGGFGLMGSNA
ncbi:MAG: hypothetical protein GWP04_06015 [Gammaproteobacteria bacterium]|nr:hypothetical protein [Gammaproteobacteria bacterium]